MKRALAVFAAGWLAAGLAASPRPHPTAGPAATPLPLLGTRLSEFPEGEGKSVADAACLQCHAADIPAQQRLNEKQWTAEVEKMTRWGAAVKETDKAALVAYLTSHFGPSNAGFVPVEAAPLPTASPSR